MQTRKLNFGKLQANSAFTLIELLVVIAVIGILAAMIAGLAGPAATKRKIARVTAELARLEAVIDNYQSKMGSYPPDNGNVATDDATRPSAATNQLYYELAGATFNGNDNSPQFTTPNGDVISGTEVQKVFNRDGIANSLSPKSFYMPKENERKTITGNVQVLVVPVDFTPGQINPWNYDSSSTNRHNPDSYDLWAQIVVGGKTNIIGNWKE